MRPALLSVPRPPDPGATRPRLTRPRRVLPRAALGGTSALKAFSAPYSNLKFMPTGGVTLASMPNYLALPCVLCVGGSWVVPQDALKARDFARITQIAKDAVAAVEAA